MQDEREAEEDSANIWKISTKYYKASVEVDLMDYKEISEDSQASFEETEAVVFHCNTSKVCLGKLQHFSFQ